MPSPSPGGISSELAAVAAISTNDIWAVGERHEIGGAYLTLAEHWDGSRWNIVKVDHPGMRVALTGVTATSTDVYASGVHQGHVPLVLRWDGTSFKRVSMPRPGGSSSQPRATSRSAVTGVKTILDWLDSWQIARRWPAGRPVSFGDAHAAVRSRRLWARGGHFGASQVPCCLAAGPGAIDVERLTGVPIPLAGGAVLSREHEAQRVRPAMVSSMAGMHAEAGDQAGALAGVG